MQVDMSQTDMSQTDNNLTNICSGFFAVCKTIVGRLSAAVAQGSDVGVQLEALDILCDLLSR